MKKIMNLILIIFLSLFCGNIVLAVSTTNNIAYWTFDNVLTDATGNGNTLTNNGATYTTSGKINGVYSFDGTNDYMSRTTTFSSSTSGTVSAWINPDGTSTYPVFLSVSDTMYTNRYIIFGVDLEERPFIQYQYGGTAIRTRTENDVTIGSFSNVVYTSSGTTWKIYINGVEQTLVVDIGTNDGTWFGDIATRKQITIGANRPSSGYSLFWKGKIDELSVWDRVLTSTEITDLYNSGTGIQYPYIPTVLEVNIINITANGNLFVNETIFTTNNIEFIVNYEVLNSDRGNFTNSTTTNLNDLTEGTYNIEFEVCYNSICQNSINYTYVIPTLTTPSINHNTREFYKTSSISIGLNTSTNTNMSYVLDGEYIEYIISNFINPTKIIMGTEYNIFKSTNEAYNIASNNQFCIENGFLNAINYEFVTLTESETMAFYINRFWSLQNGATNQITSITCDNNICNDCNTSTLNLNSLSEGLHNITFISTDDNGQVNTNANFTIDTTLPTINNSIPLEINSYEFSGNQFSCTDTNLLSCNISINSQNLNTTQSTTLTLNGNLSYTITATDLAGNTATETGTLLVNPYQYFYFKDQTNNLLSGYTFNDIFYSGTEARIKLFDYGYGDYNWTFERLGLQAKPINFNLNDTSQLNLTSDIFFARIDLNIRDKTTGTLITTKNFTIQLIGNIGVDTFTTNGTKQFQNLQFFSSQYRIVVSNSDYFSEDIFFTFTNEEVITQNIYMSLANTTNAGLVVIEVVDGLGAGISGIIVQALQWDGATSSFIRVSEGLTGLDGKSTLNVLLENKIYKFKAIRNGEVVESSQYRLSTLDNQKIITLSLSSGIGERVYYLQEFSSTTKQISYVNNFATLSLQWENSNGLEEEVCFIVYRFRGFSETQLGQPVCDIGVSGEFIQAFFINSTHNIKIKSFLVRDDNYIQLKSFTYPSNQSLVEVFNLSGLSMFVIPLLFILAIGIAIMTQSIQVGAMLLMLAAGLSITLVPTLITGTIVAFLMFVSGLVIWGIVGGRK